MRSTAAWRLRDQARTEALAGGRIGPSIGRARPHALPLTLDPLERHPLGRQAFVPLGPHPFVALVASDEDGRPSQPRAFLTEPGQGVNSPRGAGHKAPTPIARALDC